MKKKVDVQGKPTSSTDGRYRGIVEVATHVQVTGQARQFTYFNFIKIMGSK